MVDAIRNWWFNFRYRKLAQIQYDAETMSLNHPFEGKSFVARVLAVSDPNVFVAAFENLGGIDIQRFKLFDYLVYTSSARNIESARKGLEDKILNKFVRLTCIKPNNSIGGSIEVSCLLKRENINEYMKTKFPFKGRRVTELIHKYNKLKYPPEGSLSPPDHEGSTKPRGKQFYRE